MNYPKSFTDLVECFKRLPGIGGKSAERLAYHVLSMDKEYVQDEGRGEQAYRHHRLRAPARQPDR